MEISEREMEEDVESEIRREEEGVSTERGHPELWRGGEMRHDRAVDSFCVFRSLMSI